MGILFGTDGIRGIANKDLTPELALSVGRATATVLTADSRRHPKFVIGCDTRLSSGMLSAAVTAGLCSVGADVIDLGVIPTPAVAYLVMKYKADAGIMISASHNPFEYNGIKVFSGDGYKLPDALEEEIENIITGNSKHKIEAVAGEVGKVEKAENAAQDYVNYLKSTVPYSLDGMKIAVDCSNGAASVTAKKLFTELGAECFMLNDTPDGININKNCGSTHPEALCAFVKEHGLDAGAAFDGDADRCFCVDDNGYLIDGDNIMAICATDMKMRGKLHKNTIVGTIMTNLGFVKFCEQNDLNFIATKVGDRYVLEQMLLEDFSLGGEQSGHIIFRDFATTGDGELTAIQLLSQVRRTGKKLSELSGCMTKFPQCMINVTVSNEGKLAYYTDQKIKSATAAAREKLGDDGRLVLRASGTEPLIRVMTEHKDEEVAKSVAADLAEVVRTRLSAL
ncbi:MAG: phosphoglucosamine mutase [Clostridia bacterium]|nr:phosphoglucosamine mutase [Clostridia bacterium]